MLPWYPPCNRCSLFLLILSVEEIYEGVLLPIEILKNNDFKIFETMIRNTLHHLFMLNCTFPLGGVFLQASTQFHLLRCFMYVYFIAQKKRETKYVLQTR